VLTHEADRTARTLNNFTRLKRMESEYGLPVIVVPTVNNAGDPLAYRLLAPVAAFYREQHSRDTREGIARAAARRGK
jgi:DNA invertase Pin-like site-specific DNA recombinase